MDIPTVNVGGRPSRPVALAAPASFLRRALWRAGPAGRGLLVALGYYVGARIGFAFQSPSTPQSVLWLPNSILFGALLVVPVRHWWVVLSAAFPAHLIGAWQSGAPLLPLSLLFVTNCADAMLGALLIRQLSGGQWRLHGLPNVLLFMGAAALAPALVSFADAAITVGTGWGSSYSSAFLTRVRANVLTNIIVVPAIVGTVDVRALGKPMRYFREGALLLAGLLLTSAVVFARPSMLTHLPALLFVPLPFLLWAAVRFGPGLTATALFVVAFVASWEAVRGRGPFAAYSPDETIAAVQLFLLAISVPLLCLAGAMQERAESAAALRVSEGEARRRFAELDAIYRTAPVGLGFVDRDLRYVSVNDRLAELDGIPVASHAGRSIRELLPMLSDELASLIGSLAARGGDVVRREVRGATATDPGASRDWLVVCSPVSEAGAVVGVNVAVQDITELKRAEEAVRVGEARMSLAAAAASIGFWEWDTRRHSIWISERGRRILDMPRVGDVTAADVARVLHEEDMPRALAVLERAMRGGLPHEEEFRIVKADGEVHWLNASGRLVNDDEGVPTRLAGIVVDVTERKRAELEAREQRRAIAHLGRVAMVGELAGAVAHEVRQPLAAILSNAQAAQRLMAAEPPDLDEVRAILADIATADVRAGEVIRRMRALLKKENSRRERLSASDLAEDVLHIARIDLLERGVSVVTELAPDLPPVRGDRVQLQQVLLNLVLNACDAMAATPPADRLLTTCTTQDDTGSVIVRISDCGTGIPADALERVFQPFYTSKDGGLGLGLAISRTIVAEHGGRLWAANNPEGGATFFVALAPDAGGEGDTQ